MGAEEELVVHPVEGAADGGVLGVVLGDGRLGLELTVREPVAAQASRAVGEPLQGVHVDAVDEDAVGVVRGVGQGGVGAVQVDLAQERAGRGVVHPQGIAVEAAAVDRVGPIVEVSAVGGQVMRVAREAGVAADHRR
ncbi:hypothetical protein D3C86_1549240 [compost metagenome]